MTRPAQCRLAGKIQRVRRRSWPGKSHQKLLSLIYLLDKPVYEAFQNIKRIKGLDQLAVETSHLPIFCGLGLYC
jgi:hypothetical protein